MKSKTFDCVEMKRKGARLVNDRVKGMTREKELAYWRARTLDLDRRIKSSKGKKRSRRIDRALISR